MTNEREAQEDGVTRVADVDLALTVAERDAEIARVTGENRRLKVHLATEQAHAAGLAAKVRTLEEALAARGAGADADAPYDAAFNAKAASVGLPVRSSDGCITLCH